MKFLAALFVAVVALTGCATGGPAAAVGPIKEITVTISGKKVSPPPGRIEVRLNQGIKITVTSDVADEAHVHGYDKAATLLPNHPSVISFLADTTGLFEVETHDQDLQLFQLVVS